MADDASRRYKIPAPTWARASSLPRRLGHLHRVHEGGGDLSGTAGITKIGGWTGILTALAAWYASFAGVTTFAFKRPIVPTGAR